MEKGIDSVDLNECNALVLAYMGDAVVELLTRKRLIGSGDRKLCCLNEAALRYVTAVSQSAAAERLLPHLTSEEEHIFKYGRNAKGTHIPKSATALDYRRATGLECLFGYLYLRGDIGRAECLFDLAYGEEE